MALLRSLMRFSNLFRQPVSIKDVLHESVAPLRSGKLAHGMCSSI
jgi:hypothetical protein